MPTKVLLPLSFMLFLLLVPGTAWHEGCPASAQPRTSVELPSAPHPHPSLFLHDTDLDALRAHIRSEDLLSKADSVIVDYCGGILEAPVLQRRKIGRRLLSVSREAIKRIFYLSYSYRVHGDDRYLDRAREELRAVCGFKDWNPDHFLDVGEMAFAVGIGLDWLWDDLSPQDRETFSSALLRKAFIPARDTEGAAWFYSSEINWNQVCNGGLLVGAIASWDLLGEDARTVIRDCILTNPISLRASYSPEGCYAEGYNYWGYGTTYQILLLDALQSAFGTDFGLGNVNAGFLNSGRFMQMMRTPTDHSYNFYDSTPRAPFQYMLLWMAGKSGDPSLIKEEIRYARESSFSSLCEERMFPFFIIEASRLLSDGIVESFKDIPSPEGASFYTCGGTTPLFIYRSSWEGREDTYFAVKGGRAASSHAHCDIGSFFLEDGGTRWAVDLGMQDYNSLESLGLNIWNVSQNSERWKVFRIGPFSHNIITVNSSVPDVDPPIDLYDIRTEPAGKKGATLYLGPFYREDLRTLVRTAYLDPRGDLHVRDSIVNLDRVSTVTWQMCTEASAGIEGEGIVLTSSDGRDRRILGASICCPDPSVTPSPVIWSSTPENSFDAPNPGSVMTGFTFTLPPGETAVLEVTLNKTILH